MIQAKRIGHATFATPDIDRQIDYYRQVVGLGVAAREANRTFLVSPTGQLAVVLEKGSEPVCTRIAFEVSPEFSMADMTKQLAADGLKAEERSDAIPELSHHYESNVPGVYVIGSLSGSFLRSLSATWCRCSLIVASQSSSSSL